MAWLDLSLVKGPSAHQMSALEIVTWRNIGILTGGPGTGKTFTAGALLKACCDFFGKHNVSTCAPTGKAAVRLTESLRQNGLDLEATTVHRRLGVQRVGYDGKGWGFLYGPGNPLPHKVVAVDEVSMLGVDLACSLFSAIAPGTFILLIGDMGQLPSVEHGCFLRDLIAAGVPHGELTETQRNGGDMVEACKAIRAGEPWRSTPPSRIDITKEGNFVHLDISNHASILDRLRRILGNTPPGIDRVWDVQIITPVNENSPCSRKELNKSLQAFLNPVGTSIPNCEFRERDKVICTSNGFLPLLVNGEPIIDIETDEPVGDFVANGEIGTVTRRMKADDPTEPEPLEFEVSFDSPRRTVMARKDDRNRFELAYAITVHKSQGSEWPVVICIADPARGARFVASREFWTTAWSRARKLCFVIGPRTAIDQDVKRSVMAERKTLLTELILEMSETVMETTT